MAPKAGTTIDGGSYSYIESCYRSSVECKEEGRGRLASNLVTRF